MLVGDTEVANGESLVRAFEMRITHRWSRTATRRQELHGRNCRQPHDERRSARRLAARFDRAAVRDDVRLDEAQAQAESALGAARVPPAETFPEAREVLGRDGG